MTVVRIVKIAGYGQPTVERRHAHFMERKAFILIVRSLISVLIR
jgi:hypothetical protein